MGKSEGTEVFMKRLIFSLIGALAFYGLSATLAAAQSNPPPRHQTRTETGVNVNDGSFSFEEQDLSVGGEGTAGLILTRSYNSSTMGVGSPFQGMGWANSYSIYLTIGQLPYPPGYQPPQMGWPPQDIVYCSYNVSGGPKSVGFYLGSGNAKTGCGPYNETYVPMNASGASLEMVLEAGQYHYRYTGTDGAVINFRYGSSPQATDVTYPDGTRLDFTYAGELLKLVSSNRGWAILFESSAKVCAVNTAQTYLTPTSTCPTNAQTVTYTFGGPNGVLQTSRTKGTETRQYQYDSNWHLNCIIDPGQTGCRIQNTYYHCPLDPINPSNDFTTKLRDYVTNQTDRSGRKYTYVFSQDKCPWTQAYTESSPEPDYRPVTDTSTTMTEAGISGTSNAVTSPEGNLKSFTDPLGRVAYYTYQDPASPPGYPSMVETGELIGQSSPEGDRTLTTASDARGNPTAITIYPKAASGLTNLTTTSVYPTTCTNRKTCNKPTSMTNAKSNTTNFTYDSSHGGVLTEAAPADSNGVRAVKRNSYVQRAAWLKNSGGTYTASTYPVWLLSEQRTCRTTATVGNACAGGSTDEVVTSYEYGPNSGPNNLLVRGIATTANGQTLRTCFTYDINGRKLSETKPLGTGATCP